MALQCKIKAGKWQTFRQSISYHCVCAKWAKFNNIMFDQFAKRNSSDINVSNEFSTRRVFAQSDACQVVLENVSNCGLYISNITECLAEIHHCLGGLACCNKFGFWSAKRNLILSETLVLWIWDEIWFNGCETWRSPPEPKSTQNFFSVMPLWQLCCVCDQVKDNFASESELVF